MGKSLTDFKGKRPVQTLCGTGREEGPGRTPCMRQQTETRVVTGALKLHSQSLWAYTHLSLQRPPAPTIQLASSHPSSHSSGITCSQLPRELFQTDLSSGAPSEQAAHLSHCVITDFLTWIFLLHHQTRNSRKARTWCLRAWCRGNTQQC